MSTKLQLWCWRRLLRVPWTSRRSNQSILKGINTEYSLEGLMLKLKLQFATWCEELTHWKRPWCWKRLKEGGEGEDRGWDGWMASLTQWTWVWASSGRWWRTGEPRVLQSMGSQRVRHDWVTGLTDYSIYMGFPGGTTGKEPTGQCRRHKRFRFDPWVRKIPWSRRWQPIPVFLPGESHGQRSLAGYSP